MKWRDVIIGAIASLLVTILGGVAIFYATKEPDEKKQERLVYSINQTAQFSGGSQDLAFSSLTLSNLGGIAAKNVSVIISLNASELKDLAVSGSKGLREKSRERTPKNVRIVYETFLPQEEVTINLLLSSSERPTIDIRSDSTRGEERRQLNAGNLSPKSTINAAVEKFVPATGIFTGLLSALGYFFLRRRGIFDSRSDQSNAGFLLLHNGLTDEADTTLSTAVREGRCDLYTLSNYAACKAAQGHFDQANSLIRAAAYRNRSGHVKAVLLFNEGLIQLLQGDKKSALDLFKKAISISPKEIRSYCHMSVLLDAVRTEAPFNDLFKDA